MVARCPSGEKRETAASRPRRRGARCAGCAARSTPRPSTVSGRRTPSQTRARGSEEWRSLFARPPRESLARAICVYDAWGLWVRLGNLDGPRPGLSTRESDRWRRRCEELIAREDALEALRSDLPIALRAKLEKRYAFEAAQVCAGFLAVQDDAVDYEQSVGRAGHKDKGNGGAATRRRAFFGPVARALRDHDLKYWSWPALADLILESEDDWHKPPCPGSVDLYRDRDLAEVLRQDQRRTQGTR